MSSGVRGSWLCAALIGFGTFAFAARGQVEIERIRLVDMPFPGLNLPLVSENPAAISAQGRCASTIRTATEEAVLFWDGTTNSVLAKSGDVIDGTGIPLSIIISAFPQTDLSNQTIVTALLDTSAPGVNTNNNAVLLGIDAGGLVGLERQGAAPSDDGVSGVVWDGAFLFGGLVGTPSAYLFGGAYRVGIGGVTSSDNQVLYLGTGSGRSLLMREGDPAPVVGGGTYAAPGGRAFVDVNGIGTFQADYVESGGGVVRPAIWRGAVGGIGLVVDDQVVVDGAPGASFATLELCGVNSAGQVLFYATLDGAPAGSDSGLWVTTESGNALVARTGLAAPDTSGVLDSIDPVGCAISESGIVVFTGALRVGVGGASSDDDDAIWVRRGSVSALLAREGDPMPGTSDVYDRFGDALAVNARGDIAFNASGLTLGFSNPDSVLAFSSVLREVVPVLIAESMLDISGVGEAADLREVVSVVPAAEGATGIGDGLPSLLNESGQIALGVNFVGAPAAGLFIATLPRPTACNPADLNDAASPNPSLPNFGVPDDLLTPTDFGAFAFFFGTGDERADINDASAANPGFAGFGVPDGLLTPTDFSAFAIYFGAGCGCSLPGCP